MLAYCVFLVVVTGGLTELIGRQIWISDGANLYWRKYELFVFDPQLNYALKPGFSIAGEDNRLYPGVGIQIGNTGLRTPALDARAKIAVLGDSVVFGYGIAAENVMTSRLEALFDGRYQFVNAGVPGYNYEQIELMVERLLARMSPVAIVVLVNANDLQPRYYITHGGATVARFRAYPWEDALRPEAPVRREAYDHWILAAAIGRLGVMDFPRSPERLERNTALVLESERRILDYHHSGDPAIQARLERAIESSRRLASSLSAKGVKIVFGFFPWRLTVVDPNQEDRMVEAWMRGIPQTASAVDLLPVLQAAERVRPQFLVADEHPNEEGHANIARALADALRSAGVR